MGGDREVLVGASASDSLLYQRTEESSTNIDINNEQGDRRHEGILSIGHSRHSFHYMFRPSYCYTCSNLVVFSVQNNAVHVVVF